MERTKRILIQLFSITAFSALMISCTSKQQKDNHEGHNSDHSEMLVLSDREQLLANIKIDTARLKNMFEMTTLVGKTVIDEQKVDMLTARVNGRLEKLFIKNPGEFVKQGQPIYSIYSEELLADENDYLLALDQYKNAIAQKELAKQLLDASRRKLLLWTLTEAQMKDLERSKKVIPLITFYSLYNGYITELLVREGEYLTIGTPVIKTADLNTLWIETQVYSDEVKYLHQNPTLSVEFEAYPNELYKGEVVFDNPTLEQDQKVNMLRVQVRNNNNTLKPGMMAYIYLKRNEKNTIVIPKSALLLESATSVWIENSDGMYQQRMVTTGIENKKEVEILSGIEPGDRVVISGAYFLKSANVIKQGGGNMGGMKM